MSHLLTLWHILSAKIMNWDFILYDAAGIFGYLWSSSCCWMLMVWIYSGSADVFFYAWSMLLLLITSFHEQLFVNFVRFPVLALYLSVQICTLKFVGFNCRICSDYCLLSIFWMYFVAGWHTYFWIAFIPFIVSIFYLNFHKWCDYDLACYSSSLMHTFLEGLFHTYHWLCANTEEKK